MRYLSICFTCLFLLTNTVWANWQKISEADYIWGPFKIYSLSLFTETGEYQAGTRPLMLRLHYAKPVDGRDFAISLARSWSNLGITLENQDNVVDRLRKILPNIKKGDQLSYIALEDKGYFVLNNAVINEEFNQAFNDAVVAVWLDPRVEIGRKLLERQKQPNEAAIVQIPKPEAILMENSPQQAVDNTPNADNEATVAEEKFAEETEKKPESESQVPVPDVRGNEDPEVDIQPPADPLPATHPPFS